VGQTFQASLDDPIMVDGETAVARRRRRGRQAGEDKAVGQDQRPHRADIGPGLDSHQRPMVDLNTEEVTTSSAVADGQKREGSGGTRRWERSWAASSAVEGAAIGAVSGTGAGHGGPSAHQGQRVKIPANPLSFTLQNATKISDRHRHRGASRGIGRAIATELTRTHQVIGTIAATPRRRGRALRADTGPTSSPATSPPPPIAGADRFTRAPRFEKLDLLVNNAESANVSGAILSKLPKRSFDELIGVNLKGPHFLTQLARRWMLRAGSGRIVFVPSISAYTASVNRAEYCISKAGLSMSVAYMRSASRPMGFKYSRFVPELFAPI